MKRICVLIPLAIVLLCFLFFLKTPKETLQTSSLPSPQLTTSINTPTTFSDFTASFEIYTLGTKRIFTDSRYHYKSQDVYITTNDPGIIYVNKVGITWSDFFSTLPMKLEKDCLTAGTGQVFCTNNKNKLRFFINNIEDPNALDREIKTNDKLKVTYEAI